MRSFLFVSYRTAQDREHGIYIAVFQTGGGNSYVVLDEPGGCPLMCHKEESQVIKLAQELIDMGLEVPEVCCAPAEGISEPDKRLSEVNLN